MRSTTIAIATHQRRDAVVRLVLSLEEQRAAAQASGRTATWTDLEVVVVIDGSQDGTREALAGLRTGFPLIVDWQSPRGLCAARNRGLALAGGDVILFLDDDLVLAEGTLERHRRALESGPTSISLSGPCLIPAGHPAPDDARAWWEDRYRAQAESGLTARYDQFIVANASFPSALLREVGGFDTSLTGYGLEDYELGIRLMDAGLVQHFDPDAVAWHYTAVPGDEVLSRRWQELRNVVRIVRLHPHAVGTFLPEGYNGFTPRFVDRALPRSPALLEGVSRTADRLSGLVGRWSPPVGTRLGHLGYWSKVAAVVSAADRSLVPAALGRPGSGQAWQARAVAETGERPGAGGAAAGTPE